MIPSSPSCSNYTASPAPPSNPSAAGFKYPGVPCLFLGVQSCCANRIEPSKECWRPPSQLRLVTKYCLDFGHHALSRCRAITTLSYPSTSVSQRISTFLLSHILYNKPGSSPSSFLFIRWTKLTSHTNCSCTSSPGQLSFLSLGAVCFVSLQEDSPDANS